MGWRGLRLSQLSDHQASHEGSGPKRNGGHYTNQKDEWSPLETQQPSVISDPCWEVTSVTIRHFSCTTRSGLFFWFFFDGFNDRCKQYKIITGTFLCLGWGRTGHLPNPGFFNWGDIAGGVFASLIIICGSPANPNLLKNVPLEVNDSRQR